MLSESLMHAFVHAFTVFVEETQRKYKYFAENLRNLAPYKIDQGR
jgi:hypothetical protein